MPIGMLEIYRLLFVCLFVMSVHKILVTDISGICGHRAMKICRVVDLGVHQVISPLVNFDPGISPWVKKWKTLVTQIDTPFDSR